MPSFESILFSQENQNPKEEGSALERMTSGEEVLNAEVAMRAERGEKSPRTGKLLRAMAFLTMLAPALAAYEQGAHAGEVAPGPQAGGVAVGAMEGIPPLAPDTLNRGTSSEARGGVEVAPQSPAETAAEYQKSQRFILDLGDPGNPENERAVKAFKDLMMRFK